MNPNQKQLIFMVLLLFLLPLLVQAQGEGRIRLTWNYDLGEKETGNRFSFMIERQERPGPPVNWQPIHETETVEVPAEGAAYTWLDTGVTVGKTYAWRVRARRRYDVQQVSHWSNEAVTTVQEPGEGPPTRPDGLDAQHLVLHP